MKRGVDGRTPIRAFIEGMPEPAHEAVTSLIMGKSFELPSAAVPTPF